MKAFQQAFIQYCLSLNVLQFGQFTLKSGRNSPYFFNAGLFNSGNSLSKLGKFYASAIEDASIEYDILFGPAYKGIPLVSTTAIALATEHGKDVPYCFNRKEAKDHGEGGVIVGSPLAGNVALIDDVITAGTAIRASLPLIEKAGATLSAIIIALDREEKGQNNHSAIDEIRQNLGIPVISIIKMSHLISYLECDGDNNQELEQMYQYQAEYGTE